MRTRVEQARSEVMDTIAALTAQPHDTGEIAAQLKERFLAFCEAADSRLSECTAQVLALARRAQ
jgi:hypothetical protein